jgi:hypothetical protein
MQEQQTVLMKKGDFKKADYWNAYDCPLYRALRRCHPDAKIAVGGNTVTVDNEKFKIGEFRMNGLLMSPESFGTMVLSHVHHAIRYKHFLSAGITLIKL